NPDSVQATIDQACAIARHTEDDVCAGLAEADRMANDFPDLDLWHPWHVDAGGAAELGREIEAAGRDMMGITNSEGASVQAGASIGVYANSHGFVGRERGTRHGLSCALIASDQNGMQRDYWYDTVRSADDFMAASALGRKAAERTVSRLGARSLSPRQCPLLFAPPVARGLIGHLLSAVSGGALYRNASFLVGQAGKQVLPAWFSIDEKPLLPRGHGSSAFDAE